MIRWFRAWQERRAAARWLRIAEEIADGHRFMCCTPTGFWMKHSINKLGKLMGEKWAWYCGCYTHLSPCEPRILFACLMAAMTREERADLLDSDPMTYDDFND